MNTPSSADVAVIGAGVVGLAIARLFAIKGNKVCVIEAENDIGTHTSSRGSHVIHSGIYYSPDSLKAKLCVRGKKLLYQYAQDNVVRYKRLGKLIVASNEKELETLELLKKRGEKNGVRDLYMMTPKEVKKIEPRVICSGALFSPSTGIVDGKGLMKAFQKDIEKHGGTILLSTRVEKGKILDDHISLTLHKKEEKTMQFKTVINAAGLYAQQIARSIEGMPAEKIPPSYFAKGHYFNLKGPSPFHHLIYPVPVLGGLGIHSTMNIKGETRFGPDITWVDTVDYSFDKERESFFYEAIRRYYPGLQDGDLEPAYTGIRPKTAPEGNAEQDFVIQGPEDHGVPGLINLFGIDSPGFTASMAIAEKIVL